MEQIYKHLTNSGYTTQSRRTISEQTFRLELRNKDLPDASILVRQDAISSADFVFLAFEEPSRFGSPEHSAERELATQTFNAAILDIIDTIGKPTALRANRGRLVHRNDLDEADQFAIWEFTQTQLTVTHMQWDETSPLVVMATFEHTSQAN